MSRKIIYGRPHETPLRQNFSFLHRRHTGAFCVKYRPYGMSKFIIFVHYLEQCYSTFLLPRNPEQAWRSLTEPHALIRASSDVREVEATGC